MSSLLDVFNLYQKGGVLKGDDLTNFYLKLGIDSEGCTNYVLSYLGECNEFANFGGKNILNIMEKIDLKGNMNDKIRRKHEELMSKEYDKYMKYNYEQSHYLIFEVNRENNIVDTRNQASLQCSFPEEGPEGIVEFIDPLDQFYIDLFGHWIFDSPVYKEYMNYVRNEKKRVGLKFNEFAYIKTFMNAFKTVEDLTNKELVDEFLDKIPPLLFEDFITWKNEKH